MKKFFESLSWGVPLALSPFSLLLLFSQGAGPGDLLYSYKRGTEIIVLAAAALNPTTKAIFHTDLSDRRFDEAEALLVAKKDTTGLETFVDEVRVTQIAIANVSDQQKKDELKKTLVEKIDNYQARLVQIQTNTTAQQPQHETTVSHSVSVPTATVFQPSPTRVLTLVPTSPPFQPGHPTPTTLPTPTHAVLQPTLTTIPAVSQPPGPSDGVNDAIDKANDELEKIKDKTKREREEHAKETESQKHIEQETPVPESTKPQDNKTNGKH